ncbi:MAG TPA: Gfo/Idh/MocA family oxidoreductase [Cyclobacteriaceae bacterium]|nr:Gfo/Idh/MocA family oxidoreductase [Cyclobacteriaceae bacterium]
MQNDRRTFLKSSSMALAGLTLSTFIPWEALAKQKASIGANGKINVGVIGLSGMGWSDLNSMMKIPEVQVVAICDVDENVLNWRKFELAKNGIKVTAYVDYRKMLESKDVDVVIVGTPDHWHCLQMVEACAAGKDVYVEKPIGNSVQECNTMVAAQQKYNRAVQVGQWQRSQPHMQEALAYVKTGKLGKIRTVKAWAYQGWMRNLENKPDGPVPEGVHYDMWLGPATKRPFNPNRFHFNFRWYWDYAGGLMTDWGVHLIDYALLGMDAKLPKSVVASGGKFGNPGGPEETPDTLAAIYEFDGYNMIWEHAQGISNGNYGRNHGISYIGQNGTLVLDRGGWEVIADEKRMESLPIQRVVGSGLDLHTQNFIDVVKSRKMSDLHCSIQAGAHVATVCQMGNISYKMGSKVSWDAAASKFNEGKANEYLSAHYNNGYKVPVV